MVLFPCAEPAFSKMVMPCGLTFGSTRTATKLLPFNVIGGATFLAVLCFIFRKNSNRRAHCQAEFVSYDKILDKRALCAVWLLSRCLPAPCRCRIVTWRHVGSKGARPASSQLHSYSQAYRHAGLRSRLHKAHTRLLLLLLLLSFWLERWSQNRVWTLNLARRRAEAHAPRCRRWRSNTSLKCALGLAVPAS